MSRFRSYPFFPLCGWIVTFFLLTVTTTLVRHPPHIVTAFSATSTVQPTTIERIPVHRVPLWTRRNEPSESDQENNTAPYCLVASTPPTSRQINFLATQVWPAARTAATILYQHVDPTWTVCEWGCGPGLPSLAAATRGCPHVVATDIDAFGLKLVAAAAASQDLPAVETQLFDLVQSPTADPNMSLPQADLYVLSDVFESTTVARGAARWTHQALCQEHGARVWVFCQSDRVQREAFVQELHQLWQDDERTCSLEWVDPDHVDPPLASGTLWLCNVDEIKVSYG